MEINLKTVCKFLNIITIWDAYENQFKNSGTYTSLFSWKRFIYIFNQNKAKNTFGKCENTKSDSNSLAFTCKFVQGF